MMGVVAGGNIDASPAAPSTAHVAKPTYLVLLQNTVVRLRDVACVEGFGC
jgi:hypothetical protein